MVCFLFILVVSDFSVSIPEGYARLIYQDSLPYKVYSYIEENIPDGSKITYDQFVAIPSGKEITGCSYWKGCGTDYIEEFKPDYVLFAENWTMNGEITPETERLIKYVKNHHFNLIDTIESRNPETGMKVLLSVWKSSGE